MFPHTSKGRIETRYAWGVTRILLGLACLAGLCLQNTIAKERPHKTEPIAAASGGQINFPASLIPKIPPSMPTVKLTAQAPPESFLRETLGKVGVKTESIKPLSHTKLMGERNVPKELVGVTEKNHVHAYWHQQTGEVEIFPEFGKLTPEKFEGKGDAHLGKAVMVAKGVFARPDIIPHDATKFTLGEARAIVGSTAQRASGSGKPTVSTPQIYLTYVPVFRTVNGMNVVGTGSRAAVAVGNEGNIHGMVLHWKAGTLSTEAREGRTAAQVHAELKKLLEPLAKEGDVEVLSVEIAYYDGNGDSMLPVYRTISRVHPHALPEGSPELLKTDDYFVTYLAYGGGQLPGALVQGSGPQPTRVPKDRAAVSSGEVPAGDPTVGRYVVQNAPAPPNESAGFVAEANGFWTGLQSSILAPFFTNAQYYWDSPAMFTTQEASYVNSVNIALTEAHGAPWWFSTQSDCCDAVTINTIPASQGYGGFNHGQLDFWIIHSCAVVPSPQEKSDWAGPWWNVFQGLHAVMGAHTAMYFDGGAVNQPFGQNIGNGAAVVPAWFNAMLSYNSPTNEPPVDRPSAVYVCGFENDSALDIAPLPPPNCLTVLYQPD